MTVMRPNAEYVQLLKSKSDQWLEENGAKFTRSTQLMNNTMLKNASFEMLERLAMHERAAEMINAERRLRLSTSQTHRENK